MVGAANAVPPVAPRPGRGPLVGRARELAARARPLLAARPGRAGVILLAGDPGIGKSRLLEDFPPRALATGVTVLRGGASQADGMPPYLPFLEALGAYIGTAPPDTLRAEAGPGAAVLAALLPRLPERLGALPASYPLAPEQARLRLYEAVAEFLAAIAARGALVLALDDLHWADAATCDLLVHVARRLPAAPLLVVGAYREGEAEDNPAFARALGELHRRRLLLTLALRPLAEAESGQLAAGLLRGEVAPEVAALLHRQGEGNPFFEEELLRALLEDGALVRRDGRWALGTAPAGLLPPGLLGAIRLRLSRLPHGVVDLLRVASIAGRGCQVGLLAAVTGGDAEEIEERLLVAARARLVRPDPDGGYAFVHDKVREALYAEVGGTRRRRLHLAIGEALEAQAGDDSPRRLADLAFHFGQAGDRTRGVAYALAAADQALRTSAAAEALAHYRAASELLAGGEHDARRAVALLGLGDAAALGGDYRGAAGHYRSAAEAGRRAGDAPAAARAWHRLGEVRRRQEAVADARAAFERALELLGPGDSAEAAETLLHLADLAVVSLGRHAEGTAYRDRALAMAERLGDRRLQAATCCALGNGTFRGNDVATGLALLERALSLALERDDPAQAAEVCAYLATAAAVGGDLRRALEVTDLREDLARRTGDPYELRHVDSFRAMLHVARGDWPEAERRLERASRLVAQLDSPEPRVALSWARGQLRYYQGRFAEAEREFSAAVEAVRRLGSGALVWYLGWLGLTRAELGWREEALACLAELEAVADARDERAVERGYAFAQLAVGYDRLGARERAAACYPKLLPFQGQFELILIDRALGLAAACRDERAIALRHLADAEAQARRAGLHPELACILLQRGLLESAGGAPDGVTRGRAAVAEGLRRCGTLGMQALGQGILRGASSHRDRDPSQEAGPDGLSRRQLDVLRLLAQGRTNREIAETLSISVGTVANHLTAIFGKTGVDNRAGAVAYALRHGLA